MWLVKTIGALLAVVGGVIGLAGARRRVTPEVALLAAGSAASLTGSGFLYRGKGRISPGYLLEGGRNRVIGMWLGWLTLRR